MLPVLKQAMLWPPKEAQTWTQKALTQKALIQMPLIQMVRALKIRTRWLQELQRRQLILTQAGPKVWKKGANLALKTGMPRVWQKAVPLAAPKPQHSWNAPFRLLKQRQRP